MVALYGLVRGLTTGSLKKFPNFVKKLGLIAVASRYTLNTACNHLFSIYHIILILIIGLPKSPIYVILYHIILPCGAGNTPNNTPNT
jgi:hypothetical protein